MENRIKISFLLFFPKAILHFRCICRLSQILEILIFIVARISAMDFNAFLYFI